MSSSIPSTSEIPPSKPRVNGVPYTAAVETGTILTISSSLGGDPGVTPSYQQTDFNSASTRSDLFSDDNNDETSEHSTFTDKSKRQSRRKKRGKGKSISVPYNASEESVTEGNFYPFSGTVESALSDAPELEKTGSMTSQVTGSFSSNGSQGEVAGEGTTNFESSSYQNQKHSSSSRRKRAQAYANRVNPPTFFAVSPEQLAASVHRSVVVPATIANVASNPVSQTIPLRSSLSSLSSASPSTAHLAYNTTVIAGSPMLSHGSIAGSTTTSMAPSHAVPVSLNHSKAPPSITIANTARGSVPSVHAPTAVDQAAVDGGYILRSSVPPVLLADAPAQPISVSTNTSIVAQYHPPYPVPVPVPTPITGAATVITPSVSGTHAPTSLGPDGDITSTSDDKPYTPANNDYARALTPSSYEAAHAGEVVAAVSAVNHTIAIAAAAAAAALTGPTHACTDSGAGTGAQAQAQAQGNVRRGSCHALAETVEASGDADEGGANAATSTGTTARATPCANTIADVLNTDLAIAAAPADVDIGDGMVVIVQAPEANGTNAEAGNTVDGKGAHSGKDVILPKNDGHCGNDVIPVNNSGRFTHRLANHTSNGGNSTGSGKIPHPLTPCSSRKSASGKPQNSQTFFSRDLHSLSTGMSNGSIRPLRRASDSGAALLSRVQSAAQREQEPCLSDAEDDEVLINTFTHMTLNREQDSGKVDTNAENPEARDNVTTQIGQEIQSGNHASLGKDAFPRNSGGENSGDIPPWGTTWGNEWLPTWNSPNYGKTEGFSGNPLFPTTSSPSLRPSNDRPQSLTAHTSGDIARAISLGPMATVGAGLSMGMSITPHPPHGFASLSSHGNLSGHGRDDVSIDGRGNVQRALTPASHEGNSSAGVGSVGGMANSHNGHNNGNSNPNGNGGMGMGMGIGGMGAMHGSTSTTSLTRHITNDQLNSASSSTHSAHRHLAQPLANGTVTGMAMGVGMGTSGTGGGGGYPNLPLMHAHTVPLQSLTPVTASMSRHIYDLSTVNTTISRDAHAHPFTNDRRSGSFLPGVDPAPLGSTSTGSLTRHLAAGDTPMSAHRDILDYHLSPQEREKGDRQSFMSVMMGGNVSVGGANSGLAASPGMGVGISGMHTGHGMGTGNGGMSVNDLATSTSGVGIGGGAGGGGAPQLGMPNAYYNNSPTLTSNVSAAQANGQGQQHAQTMWFGSGNNTGLSIPNISVANRGMDRQHSFDASPPITAMSGLTPNTIHANSQPSPYLGSGIGNFHNRFSGSQFSGCVRGDSGNTNSSLELRNSSNPTLSGSGNFPGNLHLGNNSGFPQSRDGELHIHGSDSSSLRTSLPIDDYVQRNSMHTAAANAFAHGNLHPHLSNNGNGNGNGAPPMHHVNSNTNNGMTTGAAMNGAGAGAGGYASCQSPANSTHSDLRSSGIHSSGLPPASPSMSVYSLHSHAHQQQQQYHHHHQPPPHMHSSYPGQGGPLNGINMSFHAPHTHQSPPPHVHAPHGYMYPQFPAPSMSLPHSGMSISHSNTSIHGSHPQHPQHQLPQQQHQPQNPMHMPHMAGLALPPSLAFAPHGRHPSSAPPHSVNSPTLSTLSITSHTRPAPGSLSRHVVPQHQQQQQQQPSALSVAINSPEFRPAASHEAHTPFTPAFAHRKVICDFFLRAGLDELAAPCTKGERCQFLHPPCVAPNGVSTTRICLDYFMGYCARGERCARLHPVGRFSDNILMRFNII